MEKHLEKWNAVRIWKALNARNWGQDIIFYHWRDNMEICQSKWSKQKENTILKMCAYMNDWDKNDSNNGLNWGVNEIS